MLVSHSSKDQELASRPAEELGVGQEEVAEGLRALVGRVRSYSENCMRKMEAMQEAYLQEDHVLYEQSELEELRHYFKSVSLKFYLATLHLEQLWSLSHACRGGLLFALENSLDRLEWSNDEELLGSFALEGFVIQGWAFLYFYMHYVLLVVRSQYRGSMTKGKFQRELAKIRQQPFAEKARRVEQYFNTRIFGSPSTGGVVSNDWGALLESLRTKVTHRDRLRASYEGGETLLDKVLLDWPTLRGETYDRFCQQMQNGMFYLVTDVSPMLYEREWKVGPYRPNLWD